MSDFTPELDAKMTNSVESILELVKAQFPNDENARISVLLVSYIVMGHKLGMPLADLKEAVSITMDLLQGAISPPSSNKPVLN